MKCLALLHNLRFRSREGVWSAFPCSKRSLDQLGLPIAGPFESIIVNDEYVWENYGIPMVSFSRFPYPEYHSSKDSMEIIRKLRLNEAVEAVMGAIDRLESSPIS